MTREGKTRAWRGLDVLYVRDGRIVVERTCTKAERPKTEARRAARSSGRPDETVPLERDPRRHALGQQLVPARAGEEPRRD